MGEPGLCSRCKGVKGVNVEDHPVACTVLEGGPCSACKERADIQAQIKGLEEEIAKLKAKHYALGTTMNGIHDPFIHKVPPEIGSHIFRLCLPPIEGSGYRWHEAAEFTRMLTLGAVCRKWRELAWATPDLWDTLHLSIHLGMNGSLDESLPVLLREWLSRSGMRPLTIFFGHDGCPEESDDWDLSATNALESVTRWVIEILNLHSGRWRNLHLDINADILNLLCGSMHPNQLHALDIQVAGPDRPMQPFAMSSRPFPTQLTLFNLSPTLINIGWDNLTHAVLFSLTTEECLEVLRRAPALRSCVAKPLDDETVNISTTILHPRLRSLNFTSYKMGFLDAINVPSLEEWTQNDLGNSLPVSVMVSLIKRSGCRLKTLNLKNINMQVSPDDLSVLFHAIPSLERLRLHFWSPKDIDSIVDDILTRIFNSPSDILSEEISHRSFLPQLQFLECSPSYGPAAPFSWDRIPHLYHKGHRRSLTLKSFAEESYVTDETALQLLKLVDEGVDLQLCDWTTGEDILENLRKKVSGLSSKKL